MNIARESILGVGQGTSLVNLDWDRPNTPNTKDGVCEHSTCEYTDECCFVDGINKAKEIVKEVAEEYNGGWIACSERLPEYGEVVMCSCTNSGITISCITHKGVKPSKSVRFGQHSVIAWQPLPECFKECE